MFAYVCCLYIFVYFSFLCYVANCFIYMHFNIFIFVSNCFCLLCKCVNLSYISRDSHLYLELNHSRVCGEMLTCHPWSISRYPYALFWGLRDLRVHFPPSSSRWLHLVQINSEVSRYPGESSGIPKFKNS